MECIRTIISTNEQLEFALAWNAFDTYQTIPEAFHPRTSEKLNHTNRSLVCTALNLFLRSFIKVKHHL